MVLRKEDTNLISLNTCLRQEEEASMRLKQVVYDRFNLNLIEAASHHKHTLIEISLLSAKPR